jgi:hypothetical protein
MSIVQILVLVARSLTEIFIFSDINQPRMTEVEKGSMLQLSATWVSQS